MIAKGRYEFMEKCSQSLVDPSKMMSLKEIINKEYSNLDNRNLPYTTIEEFIKDDTKSAEFIRLILRDDEFETPNVDNKLFRFAKTRARHSAITFLIGLALLKYGNFGKLISNSSFVYKNDSVIQLWMITALYHDYGYFLKDIQKKDVDFRADVNYYLLDDYYVLDDLYLDNQLKLLQKFSLYHEDAFAFTYEEIEAYGRCSRQFYWRKNTEEKVDHGILGGIRTFNHLLTKALAKTNKESISDNDLVMIKASCLTIAQHNIFKSESEEIDNIYGELLKKLYSTSSFVISTSTPLLLFLSLIDTFECIKKFSKSENEANYLKTITILSNIRLSVTEQNLVIDFSQLLKRIQDSGSKELKENYKEYKKNLLKLGHWTSFSVCELGNEVIKITIEMNNLSN